MGSINTLIIIGSAIGGVFICIIIITCCCLYYFWKKNRRLIRQQKKEQQPLNHNTTHNLNHTPHHTQQNTSSNNNINTPNHPNQNNHIPNTNGINDNGTTHSQDDTTNSSDFANKQVWDDSKFDANFLVHPENYAPASQASNSGNNKYPLTGPSVTTSSGGGGGRGNNKTSVSAPPPSPITRSLHLNKYQQEQHRKLMAQKHRLHAIVRNARNKLQLIDSHHISFEYEVGRGKFGKVFRAMWTDSNTKQQKTVAVKWFKQDEVDQEVFEDFLKEISVAAHLPPHDNVLQIYGFCISPYALVTEFVNGGSVEISVSCTHDASIRDRITIGDCVQMLIDTAAGISHLHTVNIIHRDVAARNLLIDNISDTTHIIYEENRCARRVIVCDFGLSRITQNPDENNVTNSHIGPLKWMAPESIKQQIYNSSTDVYSFGVVMWEILCGMPPYPCTKVLSLAVEVISKQTRPFVLEWFPRPLKILMQRCWQEIAEFRPSFEDIKNELSLFKQELIDKKLENEALVSICGRELDKSGRTKEKLRSLSELYDSYLNEDKYHWDRLIKPKLKSLIDKYNEKNYGGGGGGYCGYDGGGGGVNEHVLSLHNNVSESTYYDDQIAVMQKMNISNKRISSDQERSEKSVSPPRVARVQFNDAVNVDYNDEGGGGGDGGVLRGRILPLLTSGSVSMDNLEVGSTGVHNLGDSVQIDL